MALRFKVLAMIKVFAAIAAIWLLGAQAMAVEGLITIPSSYGPQETMAKLEAEVRQRA
jgi:hypothetical protein